VAARTAGRPVDIGDTALFVVEVGEPAGHPMVVLHGGPGIDHHEFGDYLDPLADRGTARRGGSTGWRRTWPHSSRRNSAGR
jgi:hypothetical protein